MCNFWQIKCHENNMNLFIKSALLRYSFGEHESQRENKAVHIHENGSDV